MPRSVLYLPVAALDREVLGVAPARRVPRTAVGRQELGAHVFAREVVRRVVGDLPHQLRAGRFGDELAAQEGTDPLRPVLDPNSVSLIGHRRLHGWGGLAKGPVA